MWETTRASPVPAFALAPAGRPILAAGFAERVGYRKSQPFDALAFVLPAAKAAATPALKQPRRTPKTFLPKIQSSHPL
jgi:hypothetical protein